MVPTCILVDDATWKVITKTEILETSTCQIVLKALKKRESTNVAL
jgi:hypothetical protein